MSETALTPSCGTSGSKHWPRLWGNCREHVKHSLPACRAQKGVSVLPMCEGNLIQLMSSHQKSEPSSVLLCFATFRENMLSLHSFCISTLAPWKLAKAWILSGLSQQGASVLALLLPATLWQHATFCQCARWCSCCYFEFPRVSVLHRWQSPLAPLQIYADLFQSFYSWHGDMMQ